MQFREVSSPDLDHGIVAHPDARFFLFKIEPVTFDGFRPAVMTTDPGGVYVGQNVTVVGYGRTGPTDSSPFPGEAYEAQMQVVELSEQSGFLSDAPGDGGPGEGAFGSLSLPNECGIS